MRSPGIISTILLTLLIGPFVLAQHRRTAEGERKPEVNIPPGTSPALTCIVQAEIMPESSLVKGQVDIQYRNLSGDSINVVYLDLGRRSYPAGTEVDFYGWSAVGAISHESTPGPRGYTHIDSVIYRATRLERNPVMITDSIMELQLPVGIAPGETGQLLVSFRSYLTETGGMAVTPRNWFVARNWFPRITELASAPEEATTTIGSTTPFGPARYDVALRIDSSYTIIAPGEFLNEKLHFGTFEQSKTDTVFTDVLSHMFAFSKDREYTPTFESGVKDYYLMLTGAFSFPIVIARGMKLDRGYVGDLPIEVFYSGDMKGLVQGRVAKLARRLVEEYQYRLGPFPFPKLMIVALDRSCTLSGVHELIGVGKDQLSNRLLYPYLTTEIAGCWFGDEPVRPGGRVSVTNPSVLASGIAYYTAIRAMHDSLGAASGDRLDDLRELGPQCAEDNESLRNYSELITSRVPWEMRMLRFLVGDSLLWRSIEGYSSGFRTRLPSANDFEHAIAHVSDSDYSWFFRQWEEPGASLDYYLTGVAYKKDDSGVTVEGYVRNRGNVIMPVELEFVTLKGDTLIDTLAYQDFDRDHNEAFFSVHLPQRPRLVVIDPDHFLPDTDMDNNYRTRFGRRPRYREPSIPIPGFRN